MATGPYSRVYHSIVDDPQFDDVLRSDAAFGLWCKLLLIADQTWPQSAPKPTHWRRSRAYLLLTRVGLVMDVSESRYRMRGLDKEREIRQASARNAAAVRWQSGSNAAPMPRREEKRKEEKSRDEHSGIANAEGTTGPTKLSDILQRDEGGTFKVKVR